MAETSSSECPQDFDEAPEAVVRAVLRNQGHGAAVYDGAQGRLLFANPAFNRHLADVPGSAQLVDRVVAQHLCGADVVRVKEGGATISVRRLEGSLCMVCLVDAGDLRHLNIPERLLESAELFRATTSAAGDAILLLDGDSRILFANASAESMFGWSADALLGQEGQALFVREGQGGPMPITFSVPLPPPGVARAVAWEARRRDGSVFPVEMSTSAFRLHDQWYAVLIVRDVSAHLESQAALHRSSELLKTVADLASDWAYWSDPARQMLYVAPACEPISGHPPEAFLADRWLIDDIVHPDDLALWAAHAAEEEGGQVPRPIDFRITTRMGSVRWVRHVCTRITGPQGAFLGVRASNRDVTELRTQEQTNARLVAAIESAAESICITDAEGRLQYVNRSFEENTGFPRASVQGIHLRDYLDGQGAQAACHAIFDTASRGQKWSGTLDLRRRDGTSYRAEVTVSPLRNSEAAEPNYVLVSRDVTERDRLMSIAEAVTTNQSIGYVISGIRHELGNPLNSVKMTLSVLQHNLEAFSAAQTREYVGRALGEFTRVEYLLRALKNFNMYEKPELRPVSIEVFLEDLERLISADFSGRNIRLCWNVHPGMREAGIDPRALQQVLINLLVNAADAVTGVEDPCITVSAYQVPGHVVVQVLDNGIGMSVEQQRNLFKPFFTTKVQGTGLGMTISRNLLQRMGGDISIVSETNAGTIVEVQLPEVALG